MEEFRNEMNHIHAPKDLIQQTKQLMHEENERLILSQEEETPGPEKKTPWLRNILIFAAGAGLAYAGYALLARNAADTVVWQNFDTATDPVSQRAETLTEVTAEEFASVSGMDLSAYLKEAVSVSYYKEEADLSYRFNEGDYEVIFTPEQPPVGMEAASDFKGKKVLFMSDPAVGLYRAVWQTKDGWIRAESFADEKNFRAFTEKMILLDQ